MSATYGNTSDLDKKHQVSHETMMEHYEKLTAAGWQVVPVRGATDPDNFKVVAAKGVTGKDGEVRSVPPTPGQGIAIRVPDNVVAVDIDHRGDKTGADTIRSLAKKWGMLPRTDYSSSRPAPNGVLLYRCTPGTKFVAGFDGVDIVQHGHRYLVVSPTIHEGTGQPYKWHISGNEPLWSQGPDALPMLPESWERGMTLENGSDVPEKSDTARPEALTSGEPCDEVLSALDAFQWKVDNGFSRHDSMVGSQFRLVQMGAAGHPGVGVAVSTLEGMFLGAIGNDRDAQREWDEALDGALRRTGGIVDNGDPCDNHPFILPAKFWKARPELQHIREAAHSRGSSADVVFHATLARYSALIDHRIRVYTGLFSPASLNTYVIVIGESGTGKTSGISGALDDLMPAPEHRTNLKDGIVLGSGEGCLEVFFGKERVKTDRVDTEGRPVYEKRKVQNTHNVFAHVDEGEQLVKTIDRGGSTIGSILRSMWVGANAGMQNASEETTRHLKSKEYAFSLVMGFQPSTVKPVIDDHGSGMAQRFMWAKAEDPTIPYEFCEHPGELKGYILDIEDFEGDPVLKYADVLQTLTRTNHVTRNRGKGEPIDDYDSQKPLTLAKVSALLAMLNGRTDVNEEDYALAEMVWDTSCAVRDNTREVIAEGLRREEKVAADKLVKLEARKEVARQQSSGEARSVADILVAKVTQNGEMSRSDLRRAVTPGKRHLFDEALNTAILAGELTELDKRITLRVAEAA